MSEEPTRPPSPPGSAPTSARVRVELPTHVASYTGGLASCELDLWDPAPTLATVLAALDRRFPGVRFRLIDEQDRIRTHISLFVDARPARTLAVPVGPGATVHIIPALSGG